jgi:hypothetical protein
MTPRFPRSCASAKTSTPGWSGPPFGESITRPDFGGHPKLTAAMGAALRRWQLFPDVMHFRPEHVGLATCHFTDAGYESNEDDFELHEIHRLVETADACTDPRTIEDLLADLAAVTEPGSGTRTTAYGG